MICFCAADPDVGSVDVGSVDDDDAGFDDVEVLPQAPMAAASANVTATHRSHLRIFTGNLRIPPTSSGPVSPASYTPC